jgi:uncharacterized membrane protein YfcA
VQPIIEILREPSMLSALAVAALAGLVRGFAGFGAALVFVPVASALVGPQTAVIMLWLADTLPTLPIVLPALRECNWRQVAPVAAGYALAVPAGVLLLSQGDPLTLRWFMAGLVALLLALLASGWRYSGQPRAPIGVGVGAISGFFGGAAQLAGPPVLAYWLGGPDRHWRVRANVIVFFALGTVFSGISFATGGLFTEDRIVRGIAMAPVYGLAIVIGARGFRLTSETAFRRLAFTLIALAGVVSLPLLDPILGR